MTKTIQFSDEEYFHIKDLIVSLIKTTKAISTADSAINKFLNPDDHDFIDMKYIEDLRTDATDVEKNYLISRMKEVADLDNKPMIDIYQKMTADINFERLNKAEYKKLRKRITQLKDSVQKEKGMEIKKVEQDANDGTNQ